MRSSETTKPFRLSEQTPAIREMAEAYAVQAVAAAVRQGMGAKVTDASVLAEISKLLQPVAKAN